MKRSSTQFERQVDIDRHIRAGEYPSCPQLAADWEVDERTIKRDIEFMRDRMSAPIEYDRARRGYYYGEPTWSFPAISMRDGELLALLLARRALEQYRDLPLGNILDRFFGQILEAAGNRTGVAPERILQGFSFIPPPAVPVDYAVWDRLCDCVFQRHTVEMAYRSLSAETPQTYRLDPLHIANIEGEWYLFARSHRKGDILQLAVSRMQEVKDTGEPFTVPDDFDPEELKQKLFGRYVSMQGKPEIVRVRIDSSARVHLKQWHAEQKVITRKDGSIEIAFPVNSGGSKQPYANVISWVLSMGSHAQVLVPKRLKRLIRIEAGKMLSSFGEV
jgi:proteasome accessory factor B